MGRPGDDKEESAALPVGVRFTHVYLERGEPKSDTLRMRKRVSTLVSSLVSRGDGFAVSRLIEGELGVAVLSHSASAEYGLETFFQKCELRDLLDAITIVWKHYQRSNSRVANLWRGEVARIFQEENVGFRLDEAAGAHFLIDQEFERARQSAIAILQGGPVFNSSDVLRGSVPCT